MPCAQLTGWQGALCTTDRLSRCLVHNWQVGKVPCAQLRGWQGALCTADRLARCLVHSWQVGKMPCAQLTGWQDALCTTERLSRFLVHKLQDSKVPCAQVARKQGALCTNYRVGRSLAHNGKVARCLVHNWQVRRCVNSLQLLLGPRPDVTSKTSLRLIFCNLQGLRLSQYYSPWQPVYAPRSEPMTSLRARSSVKQLDHYDCPFHATWHSVFSLIWTL
jgi:hypothetical protein